MGFERFGYISYTAQTKVGEFVERLASGEVCATRCQTCGRVYFPPRTDCTACLDSCKEWVAISNEGTLVSYTRVNYAPAGFETETPYTLALAEFSGLKVFGRLNREVQEKDVKVGKKLRLSVLETPGGNLAYEFIPVSSIFENCFP